MAQGPHESKTKLLDAALTVFRTKGYTATRVEDVCQAAGLTKGSFFHHFETKEELAVAVVEYWSCITGALFQQAPYQRLADPLDRLLAYVDLRNEMIRGTPSEFTCLAGTLVQEAFDTVPSIREACERSISGHAAAVAKDIGEAKRLYAPDARWSPESLALFTQAVLQGSFILAKARDEPRAATACIDHLRQYLEMLFPRAAK